jgi:hypothetical protein
MKVLDHLWLRECPDEGWEFGVVAELEGAVQYVGGVDVFGVGKELRGLDETWEDTFEAMKKSWLAYDV